MSIMKSLLGWRKFLLLFFLVVSSIVLCFLGKLNGQQLVDLLQYSVLAFISGNSIEHVASAVKNRAAVPSKEDSNVGNS